MIVDRRRNDARRDAATPIASPVRALRGCALAALSAWMFGACVFDPLSNPLQTPRADAGFADRVDVARSEDVSPEERCRMRHCGARTCGPISAPDCAGVTCGDCAASEQCVDETWCYDPNDTRPRWVVAPLQVTVLDCSTRWDACVIGPCSPTLPDPQVVFNGARSPAISNACTARWSVDFSPPVLEETLRAGVNFSVDDDDSPASNDTLCTRTPVSFTDADFAAGRKEVTCGVGNTVTFGLRRWTFSP